MKDERIPKQGCEHNSSAKTRPKIVERHVATVTDSLERHDGDRGVSYRQRTLYLLSRFEQENREKRFKAFLYFKYQQTPRSKPPSVSPTSRKCIQRPLALYANLISAVQMLCFVTDRYSLTPHTPLPAQTPNQSPP